MKTYDTIIIGAGHNGLVAAAYLAKQGKKVLVLERREIVGGQVVTESFGDGFTVDSLYAGGSLRPDIVKHLNLASHGLVVDSVRKPFISLQADSNHLVFDADPTETIASIKRFSEKDAANWIPFLNFMKKATQFIESSNAAIMPRLPKNFSMSEGMDLAKLGLNVRMMGGKDMMRIVRGIPMTADEFVDEWFESDVVKAAIASLGIHGLTLGVYGAGTGYTLMHNWANRGGLSHVSVQGGIGKISESLASAVKSFGGEIRTNAEVKQVVIKDMRATGVVLSIGEEISASNVISAADPKHTFLSLVGAMELPPEFVWNVQSIKMRGSVAKVHLLTDGKHGIPAGTVALAPSIKYLEKAYDAAKYHSISEKPYLEVTTSGKVVSIHFQFAAYKLNESSWNVEGLKVEKLAIDTLAEYFPNLKASIKNTKTLTPQDFETIYGLTEGDLNHGQIMLDQFMFMRPIPGWSNHKTPIDNLYLCGSGVHGGGGISGASGRNVVKMVK
ncbi:NAD(P)/FAD-dependent oxidoreductase [Candidatus Villigracilis saccharophilus]|uniref:phytoene desaturase family protein n=1 Tax=Candidatus Villigracilis saccharophilus TaxID=3140684 RepID=UPI00313747C9|nr:NAD(P)/FAD-dependent oxidoreductase [Anaerolineales bacterium]